MRDQTVEFDRQKGGDHVILGVDPGESYVGWSAIENGRPIAGGTIRHKPARKILQAVIGQLEFSTGTRYPFAIAVEIGNSSPHTTRVWADFRDYAQKHDLKILRVPPSRLPERLRWRWSSDHEKDACAAAFEGLFRIQPSSHPATK